MNREDKFYIQGMSDVEKLDILAERLNGIRQRIEDIAWDISQKELMNG